MEFLEGSEAVGADIDIGNEVAKRTRTAEFTNVGFDGIIAALQSDLCDAIISGMNNTPERAKEIDFVNYLFVGQSLVVRAGNPQGITSLETLCGHAMAPRSARRTSTPSMRQTRHVLRPAKKGST